MIYYFLVIEDWEWKIVEGLDTAKEKFYFVKEKTTFNVARSACVKKGGKLFEPRNIETTLDLVNFASFNGFGGFWLGIHDSKSQNGTYVYDSDHTPIEWSNWRNGEPKHIKRRENCAVMETNGEWVDLPCDRSMHSQNGHI